MLKAQPIIARNREPVDVSRFPDVPMEEEVRAPIPIMSDQIVNPHLLQQVTPPEVLPGSETIPSQGSLAPIILQFLSGLLLGCAICNRWLQWITRGVRNDKLLKNSSSFFIAKKVGEHFAQSISVCFRTKIHDECVDQLIRCIFHQFPNSSSLHRFFSWMSRGWVMWNLFS